MCFFSHNYIQCDWCQHCGLECFYIITHKSNSYVGGTAVGKEFLRGNPMIAGNFLSFCQKGKTYFCMCNLLFCFKDTQSTVPPNNGLRKAVQAILNLKYGMIIRMIIIVNSSFLLLILVFQLQQLEIQRPECLTLPLNLTILSLKTFRKVLNLALPLHLEMLVYRKSLTVLIKLLSKSHILNLLVMMLLQVLHLYMHICLCFVLLYILFMYTYFFLCNYVFMSYMIFSFKC